MGGIFDLVGTLTGEGQSDAPAPRSIGDELSQIIAQAPRLYENARQYTPLYTLLGMENFNTYLNGSGSTPGYLSQYTNRVLPTLTSAQNTANSATRTSTFGDLSRLGPGGVESIRALNPENSRLTRTLTDQAQQEVAAGGRLLPEDVYRITSQVRGNWSNRGLGASDPAQLSEAMQLYQGGEQAKAARRAFAGGVADLNNRLYAQPILSYMGLSSADTGNAGNLLNSGRAGVAQDNTMSQLGGYASNLFGQNYSGQLDTNLQNGRIAAQMWLGTGQQMTQDASTMTSMFSSGMFCWAAREVFGAQDARWLEFRDYVLHRAPEKFRRWYKVHGADWAQRLKSVAPEARAAVARWMERRLNTGGLYA